MGELSNRIELIITASAAQVHTVHNLEILIARSFGCPPTASQNLLERDLQGTVDSMATRDFSYSLTQHMSSMSLKSDYS